MFTIWPILVLKSEIIDKFLVFKDKDLVGGKISGSLKIQIVFLFVNLGNLSCQIRRVRPVSLRV